MKHEKSGSKSGPRNASKSGPRSKPKAGSKREPRPAAPAGPKKDYKGEAKFGAKPEPKVSFSPTLGTKKATPKHAPKPEAKPARGATQAFPPKRYINVYLSLGSNVGDRLANLRVASLLIDKNMGKIARKSHIYDTEPWGKTDQDRFLNQVIMVNTTFGPRDLLEIITEIERELGREKKEKWGARIIDVDILFYGKRIIRDKGLDIPHPELHKRAFVLAPMLEIAPELEHPVLKLPIDELYMACKDPCEVVRLD